METRTLEHGPQVRVVEYRCSARRGDRAFQESHKASCIALVREGVFTYRTDRTRAVLGPGDLLLGNVHDSYECVHEHTDGDLCVAFEFSDAALLAVASSLNVRRPRMKAPLGVRKKHLTLTLARSLQHASAEEYGLELLGRVLAEEATPTPPPVTTSQQRRIGDVLRLMDERYGEPLRLDDFAAMARQSSFHFLRLFRAEVGATPHQYLTRLRLMRSAEHLCQADASVTDVAFACGFRDLSHFNHTFRAAFGMSPRAFRKARNPKSPRE